MDKKMALSKKQIGLETSMVANKLTDECIYVSLFGLLDSARIEDVSKKITKISESDKIVCVILDLYNVDAIDTAVAGYINRLGNILKLMGIEPIICGIKAELAEKMVKTDIYFSGIQIIRNLQDALLVSFKVTGYKLIKTEK
ncbi:STAS domain-containing protein [Sulfurimonas sp. SWIR-19]|uniref:STAS domain-containing protein n=1 Tax=Sulfurimonas sp. SWIR-19 TaxID=2878390 RepID=UPI001CF5DB23|nr:STAS domain-containing protein [Sulfurimonas sp. SWIR-19]UCN01234.1 STAS domain-containing protein [Sulfurimonas sp. SWIR-19]